MRRQQRPVLGSLDGAGVLMQRHARVVLLGSAIIILPGVALNLFTATLAFDRYESFSGSIVSAPELIGGTRASTGAEELFWAIGVLVNSLTACLVGGYVAAVVLRRQLGAAVTIGSGYRSLVGRLPALIIAWALGHSWIVLAGLLTRNTSNDSRGVLLFYGSPVALVLVSITVLVAPAIVAERLGPFRGLLRSLQFAKRRFGTLFSFTVASVIVGVALQYGIAYLPRLLEATGFITFGRFGWLIEGVAGQLGRLISTPVIAAATTLVYLELRMNLEGMDLTLETERAFGTTR